VNREVVLADRIPSRRGLSVSGLVQADLEGGRRLIRALELAEARRRFDSGGDGGARLSLDFFPRQPAHYAHERRVAARFCMFRMRFVFIPRPSQGGKELPSEASCGNTPMGEGIAERNSGALLYRGIWDRCGEARLLLAERGSGESRLRGFLSELGVSRAVGAARV